MSNIFDRRTQILLDFIVYLATFLVVINFGWLLTSWLVEFVVSLVNFWTNDSWSKVSEIMVAVWPTLRMIVGIGSVFVSLLLTYRKLQPHFMAMNLPETAISSQDVPNINGFDPATKQRLENVLVTVIKLLAITLVVTVALGVLHFVLTQSETVLPASSLPIVIIGAPVLVGLIILKSDYSQQVVKNLLIFLGLHYQLFS